MGRHMELHKLVKNLGNKINAIQNFFATTTDYESRGQGFESSRAHHIQCYYHIQKLKFIKSLKLNRFTH